MKAFFYHMVLTWRLDLRNKGVITTYYLIPLLFYAFFGTVFISFNPEAKNTLIERMTVFTITTGAFFGTPIPLTEIYSGEIKKTYRIDKVPLWTGAVVNFISAFMQLFLTSIIIYITAPFLFDARQPENEALYISSLVLFLLVCISIGTVLGLYIKGEVKLLLISMALFLPSIMLSGIMFPADNLPKALQAAGNIFPATWGFRIMTSSSPLLIHYLIFAIFLIPAVSVSIFRLSRIAVDERLP